MSIYGMTDPITISSPAPHNPNPTLTQPLPPPPGYGVKGGPGGRAQMATRVYLVTVPIKPDNINNCEQRHKSISREGVSLTVDVKACDGGPGSIEMPHYGEKGNKILALLVF